MYNNNHNNWHKKYPKISKVTKPENEEKKKIESPNSEVVLLIAPTTIVSSTRRPIIVLWSAILGPASISPTPSRGRSVHVWRGGQGCWGSAIGRVVGASIGRIVATIRPVKMKESTHLATNIHESRGNLATTPLPHYPNMSPSE